MQQSQKDKLQGYLENKTMEKSINKGNIRLLDPNLQEPDEVEEMEINDHTDTLEPHGMIINSGKGVSKTGLGKYLSPKFISG
jgi:hypothetical protein